MLLRVSRRAVTYIADGTKKTAKYLQSLPKGLIAGCAGAFMVLTVLWYYYELPGLPNHLVSADDYTIVLDCNGKVIGYLGAKGTSLRLEQISNQFLETLLLVEDRDFFNHSGVSWKGLARAAWVNLSSFSIKQGGSTIEMQLARSLFFGYRKTLGRKISEILMAWKMGRRFSKKEILEAYCASLYFGNGIYGVREASKSYLGKDARELDYLNAATLVAIIRAPSLLNPVDGSERLKARRNVILQSLASEHCISENQLVDGMGTEITLEHGAVGNGTDYALDFVDKELRKLFGENYRKRVGTASTTFDLLAQTGATQAGSVILRSVDSILNLGQHDQDVHSLRRLPQMAIVVLDVRTGAILAMVGGRDYRLSPFNRALAHRQPGSTFKTFVYAAAMSTMNPATPVVDAPVSIRLEDQKIWSPDNYEKRFVGPTILKNAFAQSLNSVFVRLTERLSPSSVTEMAHQCGIESQLSDNSSIGLGTSEVTPLEMAEAFTVFVSSGHGKKARCITALLGKLPVPGTISEDNVQEALYYRSRDVLNADYPRINGEIAFYTLDALRSVVDNGTGMSIRRSGIDFPYVAGKTGTSTECRDAWFVGLTPRVAVAVWIGFDDNKPMQNGARKIVGGNSAALVFAEFLKRYPSALQGTFEEPEDVVYFNVNLRNGEPDPGSDDSMTVPQILQTKFRTE